MDRCCSTERVFRIDLLDELADVLSVHCLLAGVSMDMLMKKEHFFRRCGLSDRCKHSSQVEAGIGFDVL